MISPNLQQNNFPSNIITIHGGREGANMYPLQNGYRALLLDEENKMFFIKTIDSMREFKYEEVTPKDQSGFDPSNFATKEDINRLYDEIKKLNNNRSYNNNYRPRRNHNG